MANIKGADGNIAKVDDMGRLNTLAVSQDATQSLNNDGRMFNINFSVTPVGANDLFFYLKNTGIESIGICQISVSSTTPTKLTYEFVGGDPVFVGETDAEVLNLNLGSASTLSVDAKVDTDITGLTSLGVLDFEECSIADTLFTKKIPSGIIVPQGRAIAFRRVEATGLIEGVVTLSVIPS